MNKPDNFFVFRDEFIGDGFDDFRQEIWDRSKGPDAGNGPTMLIDPSSYHPRLVVPEDYRVDCPEVYTFEMACLFVEWMSVIKLNRCTLERGIEKENGSTSSSHRRIYQRSSRGAKRWVCKYTQPGKKIQVEHNRSFRAHLNRKGRRKGRGAYRLEELYQKRFGTTHITFRNKLIPTDDEQYRLKVFDLVLRAGSFSDEQIPELEKIWRTIEKGYVVGESFDPNMTYEETRRLNKLTSTEKREGAVKRVVRKERQRAQFRSRLFDYLRLRNKEQGKIWVPSCEICNCSFGPDSEETLSIFECAHRNPLSNGIRDTKLAKDLMLLCAICHKCYTYHERIMLGIGKFDCEIIKAIVLNRREIHG